MKTFSRIILTAVAVVSMAACAQEVEAPAEKSNLALNEFGASSEAATKVTIDGDWMLSWEEGDEVDIYDGAVKTVFVAQNAGMTTVLKASDVEFEREEDKVYYAVYPSSESIDGDFVTINVAGDRKAVADEYPAAPAVGVTLGENAMFTFKNVCGLVSFVVEPEQNLASVVIFGGNGEDIAGQIEVDARTAGYTLVEGTGVKEIRLTPSEGDVFAEGRYYVAVLPQNFSEGLSISFYKSNGERLRKNGKAFTLGRAMAIDIETGGTFKSEYTIKNADELVSFLSLAPQCAANVKATLANDIDLAGVTLPKVSSFAGTFDGAGHSLKNWTTSEALFTKILSGATVTGVVLDASCTLNMKETDNKQAFVVAENAGTVSKCKNLADITYSRAKDKPMQNRYFGTIVGYSTGLVSDCHNEGNISITIPLLDYAETSGNTYQHQRVGGVVGVFAVGSGKVGVTGCTNKGNITYNFMGVSSSSEDPYKQYRPHFMIGGVCGMAASGGNAKKSSEATSQGIIENCTNSGEVKLYQEGIAGSNYANVGGVIGYLEGSISGCVNTSTGKVTVQVKNNSAYKVSAPAVGGVVGNALAGDVLDCSNEAAVFLTGYIQGGTSDAAYVGGNEAPAVGGVVAKAGAKSEDTALKIQNCKNSGEVSAQVWNSNNIRMGGVVGWTSIPVVGTAANTLENSGAVLVKSSTTFKIAYIGGVIGQSISTFNKIYNKGNITVVNTSTTAEQKAYVGGVAGYMSKAADNTFKQGNNTGAISVSGGKQVGEAKEEYLVGGVVGNTAATKVTSNGTSWADSNSNYGDITVSCPVKLYVGGVLGRIGATSSGNGETARCKNRGNITVTDPKPGTCVGGVLGLHGRGKLGDANNLGVESDPVSITVTGGASDVYVGGYAGRVNTNNGPTYPSCASTISGFGMYGSVSAAGSTAGLIAGNVTFNGESTTNGLMIASSSGQPIRLAKNCALNGADVGNLSADGACLEYLIATITPSASTTKTKGDGTPLKDIYYICANGETTEASFPYGFINY